MTALPLAPRNSIRFRWIALVFCALLSVGLAAAYVVYRRYVAYEPTAARHVPADSLAAVRFDLTHVMLYQPSRASLFPVVEDVPAGSAGGRRAKLDERGLRINSDLREVAVALGPEPGAWLVVLGGRLPTRGAAETLAAVFREEGQEVTESPPGFALPQRQLVFAQAEDGTLLFASSAARLRSALPRLTAREELSGGAGGLFLTRSFLVPPLTTLSAGFRAGSVVAVEGRAAFAGSAPQQAAELALRSLLERLGKLDPALQAAFRPNSVETEASTVQFRLGLPAAAVERLAVLTAEWLAGPKAP